MNPFSVTIWNQALENAAAIVERNNVSRRKLAAEIRRLKEQDHTGQLHSGGL